MIGAADRTVTMGPAMDLILGPLYSRQGRMTRGAFLRGFALWYLACAISVLLSPLAAVAVGSAAIASIRQMAIRRHQDLALTYDRLAPVGSSRVETSPSMMASASFGVLAMGIVVPAMQGETFDMPMFAISLLVSLILAAIARPLFLSPGYDGPNPYGAAPGTVSR